MALVPVWTSILRRSVSMCQACCQPRKRRLPLRLRSGILGSVLSAFVFLSYDAYDHRVGRETSIHRLLSSALPNPPLGWKAVTNRSSSTLAALQAQTFTYDADDHNI